jgi:drug/metabolite transporter (DMT)-like permease
MHKNYPLFRMHVSRQHAGMTHSPASALADTAAIAGRGEPLSVQGRERQGQWLMVGGGLLLGTLGVFIEEAGQPALTAVWFRCAFGLLALTLWFAATRRWKELRLPRRDAALAITAGLLMVASWVMFFAAVPRTSMSVATLVVHVQPFLIMLVGAVWLGEGVSRRQWGAALVALVGLALATGGLDLLSAGQPMDLPYLQGIGLALCAALAYAAAPLLVRRAHRASALVMAWWQCVAGTMALLWWPLWQGWPAWGGAWGWLAGMGVVHTGLAYVLVYAGVARLPAARMAMLQFVYPGSAIAFDALVYGRVLGVGQMLGVALLVVGLAVAARERTGR